MKIMSVQNTGKQHTVTIPSEIVEDLKIEKGTRVIVKEVDGKIIIDNRS